MYVLCLNVFEISIRSHHNTTSILFRKMIDKLPANVIVDILRCIPQRDRLKLGLSCQRVHDIWLQHPTLWAHLMLTSADGMHKNVDNYLQFTNLKSLTLFCDDSHTPWINSRTGHRCEMPDCIQKFPQLERLRVNCITLDQIDVDRICHVAPGNLKELLISDRGSYVGLRNPVNVLANISVFNNLRTLYLDISAERNGILSSLSITGLTSLTLLNYIDHYPYSGLSQIVISNSDTLENLVLYPKSSLNYNANGVLQASGTILQKLRFLSSKICLDHHDADQLRQLVSGISGVPNVCLRVTLGNDHASCLLVIGELLRTSLRGLCLIGR